MFWAPEEKPHEIAQEQWNFGKNVFFSESNPQKDIFAKISLFLG